jgi:hypothetical protein
LAVVFGEVSSKVDLIDDAAAGFKLEADAEDVLRIVETMGNCTFFELLRVRSDGLLCNGPASAWPYSADGMGMLGLCFHGMLTSVFRYAP